jgi:hypothetical protein
MIDRSWQEVVFLRSALIVAAGLKGGGGPIKLLNDLSQGGGDVCNDLESGHHGDGIGVLGMSAFTTKRMSFGGKFQLKKRQLSARRDVNPSGTEHSVSAPSDRRKRVTFWVYRSYLL